MSEILEREIPKSKEEEDVEKKKKKSEKAKEEHFFSSIFRLFGYVIKNETQFFTICKWLIFLVFLFVELFIVLKNIPYFYKENGWLILSVMFVVMAILTLSETLQLFAVKSRGWKMFFYVLDAVSACAFFSFASSTDSLIIYLLVLTEFYISAGKIKSTVLVFLISMPVYAVGFALNIRLRISVEIDLLPFLWEALGAIVALTVHYIASYIALTFYRQYLRLDRTLAELDESKKELEKAYAVVAEVTALEERQRIAKEIHDTAGHSLTMVIMQTEHAKRIVEENPEEAKQKIVAANLQARHALGELRDSVHLLSGFEEKKTLRSMLVGIINESTDGTGIIIRWEIENLFLSETKARFICNSLKEGIANGLRHGNATAFWFELKEEENKIVFLLSDNGKGIEKEDLKMGFGLSTMQERIRSFGGEAEIESETGEGFELKLTLPMDVEE